MHHALKRFGSEDRETILSEDERILLRFGAHAREHQKHYDSKSMFMLPPCFEIPSRSADLNRALQGLVSTTPEKFNEKELIKSCMETFSIFRVAIFRLVLIRLKESRPNCVKYALTNYVLPFAKTRFDDMKMNFFLSEREALVEIVNFILSTMSSSSLLFEQCCVHIRNVSDFLLKLLLMCTEQDAGTLVVLSLSLSLSVSVSVSRFLKQQAHTHTHRYRESCTRTIKSIASGILSILQG